MGIGSKKCSILCQFIILLISSGIVLSCASASDTLSSSNSLRDGQTLISANKTFELGFFSPGSSTNRYLGIWYHQIQEQTVVWVANRDSPIADNSSLLMFNDDGDLILQDDRGSVTILSYGPGEKSTSEAKILDSGNLVLRSTRNSSFIYWQSFDNPTDTFLPGMKLGIRGDQNQLLYSWKSKDDPARGDYSFGIQPNKRSRFVIWQKAGIYWTSGDWNGEIFSFLPDMRTYNYSMMFVTSERETYFTYSTNNYSILFRWFLGLGKIEVASLAVDKQGWNLIWNVPNSQCDVYAICGAFGMCIEYEQRYCECLQGFDPVSTVDWEKGSTTGGCYRKSSLNCNNSGDPDKFLKMPNVRFPDDNITINVQSAKECEAFCLEDCNCTAYAVSDGCSYWKGNLLNLKLTSNDDNLTSETIYIRLAAASMLPSNKKRKLLITLTTTVSIPITLFLSTICLLWIRRQSITGRKKEPYRVNSLNTLGIDIRDKLIENMDGFKLFIFSDITSATQNFSTESKLGQGGFGPVYKGQLQGGQEIAVKRLSAHSGQGLAEFKNEILLIAKLQHRNLVRLLGCCIHGEEKILVYEYMPNKSLDFFLFDVHKGPVLEWYKRFHIIEGIAQGLIYLHKHSRLRIIHRDLKTSNILLDSEMNPKISDFGMARIFGTNETEANTNRIVGTYGYMSPEYAREGIFSIKSDVYSYGVILLEIISGKKNAGFHQQEDSLNLLGYTWELWKEGKWSEIVDPNIGEICPLSEISKCINIALLCVQESAGDRPSMTDVMGMLRNETTALPEPRQLAFFTVRNSAETELTLKSTVARSLNDVTISIPQGR